MLCSSVGQSAGTSLVGRRTGGDIALPRSGDAAGKFTEAAWGWCTRYVMGGSAMASW